MVQGSICLKRDKGKSEVIQVPCDADFVAHLQCPMWADRRQHVWDTRAQRLGGARSG